MDSGTVRLPERFVERLRGLLPRELFRSVLETFALPKAPVARINTLKASPEALLEELRTLGFHPEPLDWSPLLLRFPLAERSALVESGPVRCGFLYLQNPSSVLAVELLGPKPGERVLDLCAAPGGKTSHIAQKMENRGELVAVEPVRERFYKLKANLRRLGIGNVRLYRMDGRKIGYRDHFDRVLVDAPCSAEGCFSLLEPETLRYWSPRKVGECRHKQIGLLLAGLRALKPDGRLLYCTCTFAPEENEEVVEAALRRWRGPPLRLLPIGDLPAAFLPGRGLPETGRILPDSLFQGFFLALFTKEG